MDPLLNANDIIDIVRNDWDSSLGCLGSEVDLIPVHLGKTNSRSVESHRPPPTTITRSFRFALSRLKNRYSLDIHLPF